MELGCARGFLDGGSSLETGSASAERFVGPACGGDALIWLLFWLLVVRTESFVSCDDGGVFLMPRKDEMHIDCGLIRGLAADRARRHGDANRRNAFLAQRLVSNDWVNQEVINEGDGEVLEPLDIEEYETPPLLTIPSTSIDAAEETQASGDEIEGDDSGRDNENDGWHEVNRDAPMATATEIVYLYHDIPATQYLAQSQATGEMRIGDVEQNIVNRMKSMLKLHQAVDDADEPGEENSQAVTQSESRSTPLAEPSPTTISLSSDRAPLATTSKPNAAGPMHYRDKER